MPYEPAPRPAPRRPLAALRRLLRRARPAERLDSIYNLLGRRAGRLATVVYSDRYFRYGLPLAARPAPARRLVLDELGGALTERRAPRPQHVMPLRAGARPAPAGLLQGVPPRRVPVRRGRAPAPRLLVVLHEARFEEAPAPAVAPQRRALCYRQGAGGVAPRLAPAGGARRAASPPREESSEECGPRPQFALDATSLRSVSVGALSLRASSGDKASSMALTRKVLNTERFNNGAQAVLYRRGSCGSRGSSWSRGCRRSRGSRRVRATIRAMLAFSGLFYALSFVAFYFLSLP